MWSHVCRRFLLHPRNWYGKLLQLQHFKGVHNAGYALLRARFFLVLALMSGRLVLRLVLALCLGLRSVRCQLLPPLPFPQGTQLADLGKRLAVAIVLGADGRLLA